VADGEQAPRARVRASSAAGARRVAEIIVEPRRLRWKILIIEIPKNVKSG
jgi:hypothetical protein